MTQRLRVELFLDENFIPATFAGKRIKWSGQQLKMECLCS